MYMIYSYIKISRIRNYRIIRIKKYIYDFFFNLKDFDLVLETMLKNYKVNGD